MEYTAEKFDEKSYHIKTTLNDEEIEFNVVVANDESEVSGLVDYHIQQLLNPVVSIAQPQQQTDLQYAIQQQQLLIEELKAEILAIKEGK